MIFCCHPRLSLEKAIQYEDTIIEVLTERVSYLNQKNDDATTVSSTNRKVYRTMLLDQSKARQYLGVDYCLRCDIPSYFSSHRKFSTALCFKWEDEKIKFSFGCSCSTGGRYTPCAHNSLLMYLFGFKLKETSVSSRIFHFQAIFHLSAKLPE